MKIEIDPNAGFCFGVTNAIEMAEDILEHQEHLYCLGDIVHNNEEVKRLEALGLKSIDHEEFKNLKDTTVLIRAHGEPPSTYETARKNNIRLIDATCPVVLRLQDRINNVYQKIRQEGGQIVIYGKHGHAEVNGLMGQTNDSAIVVVDSDELDKIDYSKPIHLFSQTTRKYSGYNQIKDQIVKRLQDKIGNTDNLIVYNTICPRVSGREPGLAEFARDHDVIVFVSGKKSSNGKLLFKICKTHNDLSYFVSETEEIKPEWFNNAKSVGISGATSTPMWLMQDVAAAIKNL
jgi:4-hydroxy-3-methylbut-2-enyl diphosphate reductase